MDSLKNTAATKIANTIKGIQNKDFKNTDKNNDGSILYFDHASQNEIPIKDIKDGIIKTKDDRYVGIIEVLPINYYKKSGFEQGKIIRNFEKVFNRNDYKFSIKVMSDRSDSNEIISNIKKRCKNQNNPKIKKVMDDYIAFIKELENERSVSKRFFIIFEYRSENNSKTGKYEEVVQKMDETRAALRDILEIDCGNVCPIPENETKFVTEVVYKFFNRTTSKFQSVDERYKRLKKDFEEFNSVEKLDKKITYADIVAPKGLYFDNRNYVFMDGMFYGYIGIVGQTWPTEVQAGWIDSCFSFGSMVDLDIIFRLLPQETAKIALKGTNKFLKDKRNSLYYKRKEEKADKAAVKYANNKEVYDLMNQGMCLFDVGIVLTVRAYSAKSLGRYMRYIKRSLKDKGFRTDDNFLSGEDYFRLTMPFLYLTNAFKELKHNLLTNMMPSLYCFTSYELNDPEGAVMGLNEENSSMLCINTFDSSKFPNGNSLILGTSGAGKTFTTLLISRRMLLAGIRCFFILPKKGYEYEKACNAVDGSFISLYPGSEARINPLEIIPEGELDETKIGDDVIRQKGSWLSKKITTVIMWIQLIMGENQMSRKEYNALNAGLKEIYKNFGITDNNESIFNKDKTIKEMPILLDLFNYCSSSPDLVEIADVLKTFVYGNCSNMNGQTNVNLNNPFIVFDVDEDNIGETLLPSFMYLAFQHTYSEIKSNTLSKDMLFLDEVWKCLRNKDCASFVANAVKLIRGFGGQTVMSTQEISDFLNSTNGFGETVLNNSEITICLKMKPADLVKVKPLLRLSDNECETIEKLRRGHGLLITSNDRIEMELKASVSEYNDFTTDINDRIS